MKIGIILVIFLSSTANAEERNYSQQFVQCSKTVSSAGGQSDCVTAEIAFQKKRLNVAYSNAVKKLAPEDKAYLDKIQHEWITWRDDNYKFLAEHVSGAFGTTRATSLDFMLRSVFDRASELEMISDEMGAN
ncbi:lysozyme inhibitor LprI family protein [Paraburkholderia sp. HP33-1]|uniref:lysozyme inhibitor LprI family protein n=1 Tax=Paraburkholderia sp. HP33-1 TaxID=2883243 RepID=UPI001F215B6D|nr:lysozyme inhibitor LprI family protein [Paraburkholderia sp. HP33-1]